MDMFGLCKLSPLLLSMHIDYSLPDRALQGWECYKASLDAHCWKDQKTGKLTLSDSAAIILTR